MKWSWFRAVIETEKLLVYVHARHRQATFVPKRALPPGAIEAIREMTSSEAECIEWRKLRGAGAATANRSASDFVFDHALRRLDGSEVGRGS
jgi:hypothetical protein